MWKYCLKKIVELAVVLLLISFFSFAVIYIAPGDISSMYISQEMTDEQKEAVLWGWIKVCRSSISAG